MYLQEIQIHLIQTHAKIFDWFLEQEEIKNYRPQDQGWTIAEILEHIALTSRFLLILIDKGTEKALRNVQNLVVADRVQEEAFDLKRLDAIGMHKAFSWVRPEHMEPLGLSSEYEIKQELISQLKRCLAQLERLKNGEGLLYKISMSVHELGKLNIYEYIYFLSKHAERHLTQMEENKREFEQSN